MEPKRTYQAIPRGVHGAVTDKGLTALGVLVATLLVSTVGIVVYAIATGGLA